MSEPSFDIVFYGILQPGKDKESAVQNMARLFKTTPEKIRPYFAGGRKVIKSGVDEQTAEKYRAALENVGLVIKLEARETATQTRPESEAGSKTESNETDISVAPVGDDVLENPPRVEPQPIGDISDLTLAEVGADVLENPPEVVPQPIGDISDLTLAEVGADLLENPPEVVSQPISDISNITMAEVGADVIKHPTPERAASIPDTRGLSVEDEK